MKATIQSHPNTLLMLLMLLGGSACDQAPLVDKVGYVEPPVSMPPCTTQSTLCSTPALFENTLSELRSLTLFPCAPSAPDAGTDEDGRSGCAVPAPGTSWRNTSVLIETDAPREVVVSDVEVADTRVLLAGPVTLRFENLALLARVEIRSDSPEARIELDHVRAERLTIGDAAKPFAGHVDARHTQLDNLSMSVESFELDSAVIRESFIAAQRLDSGDGEFQDVVLELGDGLFAPSRLQEVRITRCRKLSFFGTSLKWVAVPRCDGSEPTRVYDIDAELIELDGMINGEGGTIRSSRFGLHDPSEYALWGVGVSQSMFCDAAQRLESTDHIRCSACTEDAFHEADPCNIEEPAEGSSDSSWNPCEALNLATQCAEPLPERLRPQRY